MIKAYVPVEEELNSYVEPESQLVNGIVSDISPTTISLTNNKIINNDKTGGFLRIQSSKWGNSGSNGGNVILNAINQVIDGNINVDKISTLIMKLSKNSKYTGTINSGNTAKSISLTLDSSSTLTLTGDSYITSLENADSTNSNINFNSYKLYVNGKAIN